ncbi:hypothetical protein A3L09_02420 [Thermococcus profundus]|uniref:Uncharacterized protein n=1 Tax=Thermococcus profundus TaxID=49899 RepID=A0A2Z2M754_THEPR|nr:hypothetical protein [Thermococcus profundus]ASJ02200.1 hypothetical protein A3L09_02420 [Thermococcus profundus]
MIKATAYSLKALLVVPLVLGLVDAVLAVPGAGELISSYFPFISPRILLLSLFGALFVSASVLGSTARIIKFLSWIYVIPPILVLGVFNRVMEYFGVNLSPWGLNLTYLAYLVVSLPLAHTLDDTVKRANRLEEWGVEGYDGALHGVLGSVVLLLLSAGVLSLLYYKEVALSVSLPPYSLTVVVFVLGLAALVGFLPGHARKTVAFVKAKVELGPAYEVSVSEIWGNTVLTIKDYGNRQLREFTYSFDLNGKPPDSVLLMRDGVERKVRKVRDVVVDGVRYVVYSNERSEAI